jgi:hypothetical protein
MGGDAFLRYQLIYYVTKKERPRPHGYKKVYGTHINTREWRQRLTDLDLLLSDLCSLIVDYCADEADMLYSKVVRSSCSGLYNCIRSEQEWEEHLITAYPCTQQVVWEQKMGPLASVHFSIPVKFEIELGPCDTWPSFPSSLVKIEMTCTVE